MSQGRVSVLVPYRGDDGGPRDRAWAYVRQWWAVQFPGWQISRGDLPAGSPWVKGNAVQRALTQSDGHTLVVADADVLSVGVERAVNAVQSGQARWAMPHWGVYRLSAEATARVYAGEPIPDPPGRAALTPIHRGGRHPNRRRRVREWRASDFVGIHAGAPGGGLVVLSRALYEEVPIDPRFRSWGQEDTSWGEALGVIAGPPARPRRKDPDTPLFHLWHDQPPKLRPNDFQGGEVPWGRIDRGLGNPDGLALRARYRAAKTPEAMRALIDEARDLSGVCASLFSDRGTHASGPEGDPHP